MSYRGGRKYHDFDAVCSGPSYHPYQGDRGRGGGYSNGRGWYRRPQGLDRPFVCEICVQGFFQKELLDKHIEEHIKCTYEGCKYIGSPRAVAKHILNMHSMLPHYNSGHSNANEGEAYRNQRRKQFPTQKHQNEKEAIKQQKLDMGDVLVSKKNKGNYHISEVKDKSLKKIEWEKSDEPIESEEMKKILEEAESLEKLQFPKLKKFNEKSSLLEKLLHDEIIEERNQILQSIRYVVKNKFFD